MEFGNVEEEETLLVLDSSISRLKWRLRPSARRRLETDILALCTGLRPVVMVDYGGKMPELQEHLCALMHLAHKVKTAFIFCVEDRALFCRDRDEPIHSPGSLSGNHHRFLATGIHVALSSAGNNKVLVKGPIEPSKSSSLQPAVVPTIQQASSKPSAWAVDEFRQLSDYESSDKRESPIGFGELEWFADIDLFHDQVPKEAFIGAVVPELQPSPDPPIQCNLPRIADLTSKQCNLLQTHQYNMSFKKPMIQISDDDKYFTVPDLG